MILQYSIVALILLLAIFYAFRRIRQTIRETQSGCYGCKGCALKEQMMKKRAKNRGKSKKNECFEKR